MPALKQALVGGQHDFPKGLFFAGSGPCRTREIVERSMKGWIGNASSVVHLDFHTGLGRWGTYKLLAGSPLDHKERDRLTRWFGPGSFEEGDPRGVAYSARGNFCRWSAQQHFAPSYVAAFAECGTYGPLRVIAGLRTENQAHHWERPDDAKTVRAGARLRELFCPASPAWRARAHADGLDLIARAVQGLSEESRYNTGPP
jgi:hypothetical protein